MKKYPKKPKLKLPEAKDGGKAPIKGTKEQAQSYQDSLDLYNFYELQKDLDRTSDVNTNLTFKEKLFGGQKQFLPEGQRRQAELFNKAQDYLIRNSNLKTGLHSLPTSTKEQYREKGSYDIYQPNIKPKGEWMGSGKNSEYKKPVQPIIYKPEEQLKQQVYKQSERLNPLDINGKGYYFKEGMPTGNFYNNISPIEKYTKNGRKPISVFVGAETEIPIYKDVEQPINIQSTKPDLLQGNNQQLEFNPIGFQKGSYFTRDAQNQEVGGKEYFDKKTGKKLMENGGYMKQNGSLINIGGNTHENGGTPIDTDRDGIANVEAEKGETTDGEFIFSHNLGYDKNKLPSIKPKDVKVTFADKTKQIESKFSRKNLDDTIANNTKEIEMNRVKTDNQTAKQFVDVLAAIKSQKKVMKNGGYLPKALNGQTIETTESGSFGGLNWGNQAEQKIEDNARPVDDLAPMQQTSLSSVQEPRIGYNFNPNAEISSSSPGSSEYLSSSISGAASSVPGSIAYAQANKQNFIKGNSKAINDYNKFDKASTSTGTKVGRGIGIAALNFVPFVGSILASAGSAGVDAMVSKRREKLREKAEASYEFLNREKTVNDEGVVVSKNGGYIPKAKNGFNWTDENTYEFGKALELGGKGVIALQKAEQQKLYKDNSLITKQQMLPNYGQANLNYNTAASLVGGQSPQTRNAALANLYATSQQVQNDYDFQIQGANKQLATQYEGRKQAQNQYNIGNKYATDDINARNRAAADNNKSQFFTDAGRFVNNKYEFASQDRTNKIQYAALNSMYKNFVVSPEYTELKKRGLSHEQIIKFKFG